MMTSLNHLMVTPRVLAEVDWVLPNPQAIMEEEEDLDIKVAAIEVQIMTPTHK